MNDAVLTNIHATCVQIDNCGILLLGKSGCGKSDLALRLIAQKNAVLVADDRVDVKLHNGNLYGSAPAILSGKLEVRGVGIVEVPCVPQSKIVLAVELTPSWQDVERLPEKTFYQIGPYDIELIRLCPFEASAVDKVVIKLQTMLDKFKKNHKINDTTLRKTTC